MRAVVAFFLTASLAAAETDVSQQGDIPVDEWRNMVLGKTLTYTIDGAFFALERYATSGNRVEIQIATGECRSGTWAFENGTYCFYWEQDPKVCFRHFRVGEQIIISNVVEGVEIGSFQTMSQISEAPLQCGMNLS